MNGIAAGRRTAPGTASCRRSQADADLAGRIDWGMVGVDFTSCRAHQHAAGARKARPRVPKEGRRPGTTAPMRASDGPGAV